jgi:hypothetical protein
MIHFRKAQAFKNWTVGTGHLDWPTIEWILAAILVMNHSKTRQKMFEFRMLFEVKMPTIQNPD